MTPIFARALGRWNRTDVAAVQENRSLGGIVEAGHERRSGGFSATCRADQRVTLCLSPIKRDVVQDFLAAGILEADFAEFEHGVGFGRPGG